MSCNKLYFDSKKAAKFHAKSAAKQNKRYTSVKAALHNLKPYKCFMCDGWHLTSMSKKSSRLLLKHNTQRGIDIDLIKKLRDTPTLDNLLAIQQPWMILNIDDTRSWVTFTQESGFSGRIVLT